MSKYIYPLVGGSLVLGAASYYFLCPKSIFKNRSCFNKAICSVQTGNITSTGAVSTIVTGSDGCTLSYEIDGVKHQYQGNNSIVKNNDKVIVDGKLVT